jgi:RNA polymerase sigma-70 factor (ECF subfamily)
MSVSKPDPSKIPAISELRAGEERAWTAFFAQFDAMIRAIVAWPRWHFDAHTCEDAAQTIKVGIVQSIGRLQSEASLPAFVKKICVNRCIDLLRRQLREQNRLVPLGRWNEDGEWEDVDVAASGDFDPVAALQRAESVAAVRAALAQMDEQGRECLLQFYVSGLSYKEMALRQGVTVNTIGSRMSRCLDRLGEALRQGKFRS